VRGRRLSTRYRQDRHELHRFAREVHEVRMIFEELRGGFVLKRALIQQHPSHAAP